MYAWLEINDKITNHASPIRYDHCVGRIKTNNTTDEFTKNMRRLIQFNRELMKDNKYVMKANILRSIFRLAD